MMIFDHQKGQYFEVEGAQLYVETAGKPSGSPLILLHGGVGSLADMNSIAAAFSDDYYLIGMDLRGHGRSTTGGQPLTYQRYQQDIEAILKQMEIDRFTLIGFSDGGIVGYRLAAARPESVNVLVTIGAHSHLEPDSGLYQRYLEIDAQRWESRFPGSAEQYERLNPAADFKNLIQSVVTLWTDTGCTGYPGDSVSLIQAPTLILRGDQDPLCLAGDVRQTQLLLPQARALCVPCAGHEAHQDNPQSVVLAVRNFLAETAW